MNPKKEIKHVKARRAHFPIEELRNNTPNFFGHGKTRKLAAHSRTPDDDDDDEEKSDSWIWLAAIGGLGAAGYLWIKNYPDKARAALESIGATRIPGVSDLVDTIAGGKTPSKDLTKQVNAGAAAMAPHLAAIPNTLSPGVKDLYTDILAVDAAAKDGDFRFDARWSPPPKLDGPNPDAAAKDWMARRYFAAQAWGDGKSAGMPTDKIIRTWKAQMGSSGDLWNRASADRVSKDIIDTAVDYHTHKKTGLPVLLSSGSGEPQTDDYRLLKSANAAIIESERTGKPSNLGDVFKAYRADVANKGLNPDAAIAAFIENPDHPESVGLGARLRAGFIADVHAGMKTAAGDPLNPAHHMATEFLQMGIPESPAEIQKWSERNPEFLDKAMGVAASAFIRVSAESGIRSEFQSDNYQRGLRDHYNMVSTGTRPAAETATSLSNWLDIPVELLLPRLGAYTPGAAPFLPTDLDMNRVDKKGAKIVGDDPNVINYHNHFRDIQDALHEVRGLPVAEAQARVNTLLSQKIPEGSDLYRELRDHNNFGNTTQSTAMMASALMSRNGSLLGLPIMGTLAGVGGAIYNRWNNPTNKDIPTADWIKDSAINIGTQTADMSAHFAAQQIWWRGLDKATQNAAKAGAPPGTSPTSLINKVYNTVRHPIQAAKAIGGAVVNPAATSAKVYGSTADRIKSTLKTLTASSQGASHLSGISGLSATAKLGAVLKGVRALAGNTAASAIIWEGASSGIDLGRWGYGMLTNTSGYDDAKISEVAQNTFANGGKGMGFWGTALSPLQAFNVRQGKAEYVNQGGDDSKMNPLGAGYKKGAEMLVDAKLMQASVEFANGVVKDSPVFAGLAPDVRLMMAGSIADRAFAKLKTEAEPFKTGVIDVDGLSKPGENPFDSVISRITGKSKPRGDAPAGVEKSTWDQQNKTAGQTQGLFNVMGPQEVQDLVRTSMAATYERVGKTVRDALDTHPIYRHLSADKKDELAFNAQSHWESQHQALINNVVAAKTPEELKSSISQANAATRVLSDTVNGLPTQMGVGQKLRYDIGKQNPAAIARGVDESLGQIMKPDDFQALRSPDTAKEIMTRTGFSPEQLMERSWKKTLKNEDVFKKSWELRGAIRQKEVVDEFKENGLGDLFLEYKGGDRVSDTYTAGGKTYGGAGSPQNSRYGLESELNPTTASLKNQRIVLEGRRDAAKAAAYQRLGIDEKDPNAEMIFHAKVARLPENAAKEILAPFTKANTALHALNRDIRSQGGHVLNPQLNTIERFDDNTFLNPEATDKLLQRLGEKYGFDKVEPPSAQGRYYVDARGNAVDLAEGQEPPKGFSAQNYGFDSSKWGAQGDAAPTWTLNPSTGRVTQVSPEAIRRGYKVESPLENPGRYLSGISRYQTEHPEFFAANDPRTHEALDEYWRQHEVKTGTTPDPFKPAPQYIMGADGRPTASIGDGDAARPVTREDVVAHIQDNPNLYRGAFPANFRGNTAPMVTPGDRTKQSWTREYWMAQGGGDPAKASKAYSDYQKNLATQPPKVPTAETPRVPLPREPANVKPTPEIPPVKPLVQKPLLPVPGQTKVSADLVWARGCKIAAAAQGEALAEVANPLTGMASQMWNSYKNLGAPPQDPPQKPVTPPTPIPQQSEVRPTTPPVKTTVAQQTPQTTTPVQTPVSASDAVTKANKAQAKTTEKPTQDTDTNAVKPEPSMWDQAKAKAQEGMDWAQKYNLDLAAIPVGLGLMLMGGKAGAIMGALVLGGGAYGAYQRYQSLNNAGGEIPPPTDPQLLAAIQADPKKMDDYRAGVVKQRLGAMQAASTDEGKWQQWIKTPDNAKFFENLKMAHDYLPSFVKSRVEAADPNFKDINNNQFEMMISEMTGKRIGKPESNWADLAGLGVRRAKSKLGI